MRGFEFRSIPERQAYTACTGFKICKFLLRSNSLSVQEGIFALPEDNLNLKATKYGHLVYFHSQRKREKKINLTVNSRMQDLLGERIGRQVQ